MARLDFPDYAPLRPAAGPAGLEASSTTSGAPSLPDPVPWDCPGAREIGFSIPEPQVALEPLPGGIEFASTDRPEPSSAKRAHEAIAWYGLGVPIGDPADIVLMLRNEISDSRHAQARRVVHV